LVVPDFSPFLVSGLATAATYILSAVGIVVLYRASGVVNFAQGAVGALAAFVSWSIVQDGWPDPLGWVAGVAVSIALSYFYGRVLAPRLAYGDPVMRAVATLSFALILLGFMGYVWGEAPRKLRLPTDISGFELLGVRITVTRAIAFGIAVAATAAIMLFLARSRLGLQMRALANSRDLSAILGVPVLRADGYAWVISGALAGVSGILLADLQRLSAIALTFAVIPAISAAVVGRFSSLPATVAGGLVIGVCEALLTPVPVIGPFRTAVPFVFAVFALLWMQRRPTYVYR
jgi:branched-subunit amino acid ABC-type transport system permease component